MDHSFPLLTQRLKRQFQDSEECFSSFLRILDENPGSCDEVWLATDYGFPSLKKHEESARKLLSKAEALRKRGIKVSFQVSNTIGHGEYMSSMDCSGLVYENSPARRLVGHDGKVANYCFCWRGEYVRQYLLEQVRLYARYIQPYCVYVDDDFRAQNHFPVQYGCFCEDCLTAFGKRVGRQFDRESLVKELNEGDLAIREAYVAFLRESLSELLYEMFAVIHEESPETEGGLQHGLYGGYTGFGYEHLFDAIHKATGERPVHTRPGAGAYNDHDPNEQIEKCYELRCQNFMLPPTVKDIRPEIENLPCVVYGKSIPGTCMETSLHFAGGATSMSYAMVGTNEDILWHGKELAAMAAHRKYWENLAAINEETQDTGMTYYIPKDFWRCKMPKEAGDFAYGQVPFRGILSPSLLGFPLSFGDGGAGEGLPILLHEEVVPYLSKEDLRQLCTLPVLTSGEALDALFQKGYGEFFHARAVETPMSFYFSKYLPHPVNGEAAGKTWSQSFFYPTAYRIEDLAGDTEMLTVLGSTNPAAPVFYDSKEAPFGYGDALVKTALGATWAVFGQTPFHNVLSFDRRCQILTAAEHIAPLGLAAILRSPWQATVFARKTKEGRTLAVTLVNRSVGESDPLCLEVRRPAGKAAVLLLPHGERQILSTKELSEDRVEVEIPPIAPWNQATVVFRGK